MAEVTLRAEPGRATGSRHSRRLRRAGQVPGIVYGRELDPIPVAVDHRELQAALHTEAGANVLITLEIAGADPVLTIPKQVQRHPYRNEIRHVDFVRVSLTEKTRVDVPIHLEGEAAGVKEGGVLTHGRTSITVEALPRDLPGAITLDISGMGMGDALRVADLPQLPGVTYLDDPDEVVAIVTAPSRVEEPVEAAEVAEGAEAEGEGAEAEEPAEETPTEGE